jgi:hypothetical protein
MMSVAINLSSADAEYFPSAKITLLPSVGIIHCDGTRFRDC